MPWVGVAEKRGERARELCQLFDDVAYRTCHARHAVERRVESLRERMEALRRHAFLTERNLLVPTVDAQIGSSAPHTLRAQLDACRSLNEELTQRIESLAVLLDTDPSSSAETGDQGTAAKTADTWCSAVLPFSPEPPVLAARLARSESFNTLQLLRVMCAETPLDHMDPDVAYVLRVGKAEQGDAQTILALNEKMREAMQRYVSLNREQCQVLREKVGTLEHLLC